MKVQDFYIEYPFYNKSGYDSGIIIHWRTEKDGENDKQDFIASYKEGFHLDKETDKYTHLAAFGQLIDKGSPQRFETIYAEVPYFPKKNIAQRLMTVFKKELAKQIESNQIKLADGTNTTFDSNNADIRYSKGGQIKEFIYTIGGL
jgi:hypothetical protein